MVIPTLVDEERALEFLRHTYQEIKTRLRGSSKKDPAVFRFDATRFIGKLKPAPDIAQDSELLTINFEVQIRTAFEHAWSVTTHALAYKTNQVDWKTLRLAAQLKASVEQLDGLILGFESMASVVTEHLWPEVEAKRIIEHKFKTLIDNGQIPRELLPSSWGRFCDNVLSLFKEISHDRSKIVQDTNTLLNLISSKLEKSTEPYPVSITLIQYCIGVMLDLSKLSRPFRSFIPIVTKEMTDIFPKSKLLGEGFKFIDVNAATR